MRISPREISLGSKQQGKTYQEKPRQGASEQHFQMPPLPIMRNEVGPRRPGHIKVHLRRLLGLGPRKLIYLTFTPLALAVRGDIFHSLLDVSFDIECVTRRLWDRQAEVKREAPRHRSKSARVFRSAICTYLYSGASLGLAGSHPSKESHTRRLSATSYRQH